MVECSRERIAVYSGIAHDEFHVEPFTQAVQNGLDRGVSEDEFAVFPCRGHIHLGITHHSVLSVDGVYDLLPGQNRPLVPSVGSCPVIEPNRPFSQCRDDLARFFVDFHVEVGSVDLHLCMVGGVDDEWLTLFFLSPRNKLLPKG